MHAEPGAAIHRRSSGWVTPNTASGGAGIRKFRVPSPGSKRRQILARTWAPARSRGRGPVDTPIANSAVEAVLHDRVELAGEGLRRGGKLLDPAESAQV